MKSPDNRPEMSPEAAARWGLGCLLAGAAILGALVFITLISIFLQPPVWLQIVLGTVIAIGAALFAWLVASALGRGGAARAPDRGVETDQGRSA